MRMRHMQGKGVTIFPSARLVTTWGAPNLAQKRILSNLKVKNPMTKPVAQVTYPEVEYTVFSGVPRLKGPLPHRNKRL